MNLSLVPTLPSKDFVLDHDHMKFYLWSLPEELYNILDMDAVWQLPVKFSRENYSKVRTFTMIRHLESKYNEYKRKVRKTQEYKRFKELEELLNWVLSDIKREELIAEMNILAKAMLNEFVKEIGCDYSTDISQLGHKQGEELWQAYGKLIEMHPHLLSSMFIVSPYYRTRLTTYYLLKYIKWLDIDLEALINPKNTKDIFIGGFNWKQIVIKLSDRVRERDHGKVVAPSFIREYLESNDPFSGIWMLGDDDLDQQRYYTAPNWGESQTHVNERIRSAVYSILNDRSHDNFTCISHHLTILGCFTNTLWWAINTFLNLDTHWKPVNWWMSIFCEIPKTDSGQENKLRMWLYNAKLVLK